MKFGNKEIPKQFIQDNKNFNRSPVKVDWKTMKLDMSACIPHGKYSGKTLEWVMEHDENYISWLYKENLFGSWGLIAQKQATKVNRTNYFLTESGEKWICLIEYPVQGQTSQYL